MATNLATMAVVLLLSGVSSLSVDFNDEAWEMRPVTKVINLLKDMSAQLEKENDADVELYEKLSCWCESNDKTKTKAIEIANQQTTDLVSAIDEGTARSAQLATEINKLEQEVTQKKQSLGQASEVRSKENSEFSADETNMMSTISSLTGAVQTLSSHHGSALTQDSMMQVQDVLQHHWSEHEKMFPSKVSSKQHAVVVAFLQQPVAAQSYNSRSGAIFGLLKGMKENFESNLNDARSDEDRSSTVYGQLKSAKQTEMGAAQKQIDSKTAERASTNEKLVADKDDLEDTRAALSADTAFLADLKSRCSSMDATFASRRKTRADEIQAVSEAIDILNADDAHDTFSRSLKFIQAGSSHTAVRTASIATAAAILKKSGSPRLVALAISMKNDAFAKVVENISKMIVSLNKTQVEEFQQREFCITEFNQNEDQSTQASDKKQDLDQKIEDLTSVIDTTTEAIAQLQKDVANMHLEMKKAGQNREAANQEFQMTVADQRATQQILKKALNRLAVFYKQSGLLQTAHMQDPQPGAAVEAMPKGFTDYKNSGKSEGVMAMIERIIAESADVEKKAVEAENEEQQDYEAFLRESNNSVAAATVSITDKSETLAHANSQKTLADADLSGTTKTLQSLAEYNAELHRSCDYVVRNFEERQTQRTEEMESLGEAKATFSGANFGL